MKPWTLLALILVTTACAKQSNSSNLTPESQASYHDIPLFTNTPTYRVTTFTSTEEITFTYFYMSTSEFYGEYSVDHAKVTNQIGGDFTLEFHDSDCHPSGHYLPFSILSLDSSQMTFKTSETIGLPPKALRTSVPIPDMPAIDTATFTHSAHCRM